jgi:hypothetical protein
MKITKGSLLYSIYNPDLYSIAMTDQYIDPKSRAIEWVFDAFVLTGEYSGTRKTMATFAWIHFQQ